MSKLTGLLKNYGLYVLLFVYGLFYHISSSEFWPITISKTWLTPENFEYSLLQKPIFTLLLSVFHFLPLTDIQHLYLVKIFFAAIGALSLWFFCEFVNELFSHKLSRTLSNTILILLLAFSPTLLNNFFRVRSDQLSFFVFILFLIFNHRKNFLVSVALLIGLPLIHIKGVLYLPAGIIFIIYTYYSFLIGLKRSYKINLSLAVVACLVWLVSFNISSISYFLSTFEKSEFPNEYLRFFLNSEFVLLIATVVAALYFIIKKDKILLPYSLSALLFLFFILVVPQSYPYFIASFSPIIYIPLIYYFINNLQYKTKTITVLSLQIVLTLSCYYLFEILNYNSSNQQMSYIKEASRIISSNKFNYLDGMGILPRQKFVKCFASPNDEAANSFCKESVNSDKADVIILTHRLNSIGYSLFDNLNTSRTQIIPGFWIKNSNADQLKYKKFAETELLPAVLIFNF